MKNEKQIFSTVLTVVISVFLVSVSVYAVTTIGTNVTTEGYATSTVGYYTQGLLDVGGAATIRGNTTIGGYASSTVGYYTMGLLDVGGAATIRGNTTIGGYASSTDSLNTQGTLHVGGAATIDGSLIVTSATSSNFFVVGSPTPMSVDYSGDLMVQDDVEIGGWASTTVGLYTMGVLDVGSTGDIRGNVTIGGEITSTGSTTASIINMTTIKFTPATTPTPVVIGECFVTSAGDNQLKCYDGSAWQSAW